MRKLTANQQTKALEAVAEWLGQKGLGRARCKAGKHLDAKHWWNHADGSDCDELEFGPAPTGPHAARHGEGPELNPTWDWPGSPTPTILLEGGPYDWAIAVSMDDDVNAKLAKLGVWSEPYAGYALCLYPID